MQQRALTRRQLLGAGAGAGALALYGFALDEPLHAGSRLARSLVREATAPLRSPSAVTATAPGAFHTRPDLRLASLTVRTRSAGVSPGLIFIAPYNAPDSQAGVMIADDTGMPIWESPVASGLIATDFRMQTHRGQPALTWWQGNVVLGHGVGEYVIYDASYQKAATVTAGNGLRGDLHEFLLTSRGTALLTVYRITTRDLRSVGGSSHGTIQDAAFQEIDLASGRVLMEWHSLDHVPLEESYSPVSDYWDYFHINSIDVDTDDNLLISSRSMHTVYKLDRRTGAIIWRLGGKHSDFAMGRDSVFAWQHHARRQPNGNITIFDNGASPTVEPQSRGIVLTVDERAKTARLARQYTHPVALVSQSQGSLQMQADGNAFVGWGQEPYVSEFDATGQLVFDAVLPAQSETYRAFRLPWTGSPSAAPDVATQRGANALTVYASWNGDTRTARWVVLAGARGDTLQPIAATNRLGFETAISLPPRASGQIAVRAIDANGAVLGQSAVVSV